MRFVSDFMNSPASPEASWMTQYFGGGLGYDFVRYFALFRCSTRFPEHVGRPCSKRWVKRMKSRFLALERERDRARREMDLEALADIEMGKFELK